jgi:RNA methyltransferase, TrmH family
MHTDAILAAVPPDITSPANDRIKWLVRLRDRRHRDAEGVFVVEGSRLYQRALAAGLRPEITFTTGPDRARTVGEMVTVDPAVLDKASYRSRSQGLIAVFPQFGMGLDSIEISDNPLILIAEDIEKPGNLGAMARTASAAGADALITVGKHTDPFNPNAVRSSTGALFTLPMAISSWDETRSWLEERGVALVAATPEAGTSLWEVDLTGPTAIVIGAEDAGLSAQARSMATRQVGIPQTGVGVDSMNASVAAAVMLFESVRQRTS